MHRVINPMNDYAFKRIFGGQEHTDILLSFCNAVLEPKPGYEITSLEPLDRELDPEFLEDKASRLDILAKTSDGALINIEIQMRGMRAMRERALYYWSRLYSSQIRSGDGYQGLTPVISVLLLDYNELPGDHFHSIFHLVHDEDQYRLVKISRCMS